VSDDVLSLRALNRATLARQLLLERRPMAPLDAVDHLVGLQAQVPHNPYHALWSRLEGFDPESLSRLIADRQAVRTVVMRGTLHLVSADDCLVLRPLVQPVLDAELARHPEFGPALRGVDMAPVLDFARPLLAERPRTGTQLRAALAERFPDLHAPALAYACRNLLAFVQVPPRGLWGRSAQVTSTTTEAWLGRPLAAEPSIDDVVLRYVGAFGPVTPGDVAAWSGLTGLREVVDRLRPRLRTFRDERGRELFDLPDAPRPDADTPAPPRFLPEYDNALLSHADRTRFMAKDDLRGLPWGAAPLHGAVLVDGRGFGTWHIDRDKADGDATLVIDHVGRLAGGDADAVGHEGLCLLRFLAPDATAHDVRLAVHA
jgi:DNA glycosylase AlkZ-like